MPEDLGSDVDNSFSKNEEDNHWEDIVDGSQQLTQSLWIDVDNTLKAKKKLIRILIKDVPIRKERWGLCRILTTLVYY